MNNKNNNFKLLCIGVIAFSAVAIIIFVSLGGGEGVVVQKQKDGFNDILPDAKVETISDDRLMAARKEDARRKKEQMQGITGSSFQLLEIQENEDDKVNQAKVDSLFNDEELTSAQRNIHSKIYDGNYGSGHKLENDEVADNESFNIEDSKARVKEVNDKINQNRKERYKQMQQLYGKELMPDMEDEKPKEEKEKVAENNGIEQSVPKPRKKGFNTLNSSNDIENRDIKAVVHGTHKDLTNNSVVKLRLLDAVSINGVKIPRNSFVYGKVSFANSRVQISVDNINYQNKVLPFKGQIFDQDGSQGIHVPDNAINDATKDGGGRTVSGISTTISGTGVFGQIASKMASNAAGTVKDAVVSKINKNKVTISDNYLVTIKMKDEKN